jgi:hypothetical protein
MAADGLLPLHLVADVASPEKLCLASPSSLGEGAPLPRVPQLRGGEGASPPGSPVRPVRATEEEGHAGSGGAPSRPAQTRLLRTVAGGMRRARSGNRVARATVLVRWAAAEAKQGPRAWEAAGRRARDPPAAATSEEEAQDPAEAGLHGSTGRRAELHGSCQGGARGGAPGTQAAWRLRARRRAAPVPAPPRAPRTRARQRPPPSPQPRPPPVLPTSAAGGDSPPWCTPRPTRATREEEEEGGAYDGGADITVAMVARAGVAHASGGRGWWCS